MMRLLVVSPDVKWIEYLQLALEPIGIEVVGTRGKRSAQRSVSAFRCESQKLFAGVLISALAAPGQGQSDALLETADVLAALRQASNSVPILLWSPYAAERLASIVSRFDRTVMLTSDAPAVLKAALESASSFADNASRFADVEMQIEATKIHTEVAVENASPSADNAARFAKVEMQIGATNIRVEIALDGKPVGVPLSRDWSGRAKLTQLEKKFRTWVPWQRNGSTVRYTDNWLDVLREAGEDLANEIEFTGKALSNAIEDCLSQVQQLDFIHFRFNLLSGGPDAPNPFPHVPFELLYDTNKGNFIRALAPIARRVSLNPESRTATLLHNTTLLTEHVLFVKSDAHGTYEFSGSSFGGKQKLSLAPLKALNIEFDAVEKERIKAGRAPPELLALAVGDSALSKLKERLDALPSDTTPMPQILHYAGHSIQADDGTIYLVLPGAAPGRLLPVPMSEFAGWARKAGAQLVILSSCESSAPEAVFRLSQAGIPTVIGFRWEVNDTEAAAFTGQVHKALAGGTPLARAFHIAVSAVRTEFLSSPTFASPMLVVQDDEWAI